ncbi:MAG: hypothetical protein K9G33_06800 [Sneathiella sp.]|nr:hypothetical protein [Sneathiella sp.]
MRPATRSTFDVLYWLQAKAWVSSHASEIPFLLKLLYLCQAAYAAGHNQRKLMPATFLATDAGPIEPDIFLAMESGFSPRKAVPPSAEVETFLTSIWESCKDKSQMELDLVLSHDTAITAAISRGRNSEIILAEMAAAYKNGLLTGKSIPASASGQDGAKLRTGRPNLEAAPNSKQEIRFTADGRSVIKWVPTRRLISKERSVLN